MSGNSISSSAFLRGDGGLGWNRIPTGGLWNIVDILAFGAFVLRSISLSFRWRCYSFACDDIFDYLDAFFLSVNQCILTSNSTWKHFGDYSGTCGECTWLHLLTID